MCQRKISSKKPIRCITHLRNLILCKFMSPSLRIVSIVLSLPNCRTSDFLWIFRVRFELVVQWRMLARGFDAAVVDVGGGSGGGSLLLLVGFLDWRRIGLAVNRVSNNSRVVLRKRGCQTRSHGNGSGS